MGRDMDIGIPTTRNLTRSVDVGNLANVLKSMKDVESELVEVNVELKKLTVGNALLTGDDPVE